MILFDDASVGGTGRERHLNRCVERCHGRCLLIVARDEVLFRRDLKRERSARRPHNGRVARRTTTGDQREKNRGNFEIEICEMPFGPRQTH